MDAAAVLLLDPVTNWLEYVAWHGFWMNRIPTSSVKLGESYAGKVAIERRIVQIPNLAAELNHLFRDDFLRDEKFVSYYGVPLIVKGKVIGVVEIFNRTRVARDSEWLDFLNSLAGQAAIAIDNWRLWEQVQRYARDLELRVAERTADLNRANTELEHANRTKDEFLATMSHELRTPLNSILGLSESLLEQTRDPLNERQQHSLRIIEASGHHLLELINDILDLSKIEAGKLDFYPEMINVAEVTQASLAFVKSQAMKKSIELTYEQEELASRIHADPRRVKQILVNLLINAVKFTPEHGRVGLHVSADKQRDLVRFAVRDNGIGIAPEDMRRLFQPFVQVNSQLNRQFEGTGLGLVLVHKLTDMHGGSVQVESEPGVGSCFTVNLPWGQDRTNQQDAIAAFDKILEAEKSIASHGIADQRTDRKVVLLAEDNLANILTIGEYLEDHGYEIIYAHDGSEAVEKAETGHPSIILMDIQMPVMDGLEAMRRLRANPHFATTPIIALTALAMPGDRQRCLSAGANEYMSKPIRLQELVKMIGTWIEQRG